jgi:two-component system OmpR family sensor kinase
MRRLPMRVRVASAFALAMAAVLAGTGWFLYARLDSHLRTALNAELRVRAQDLASLIKQPRSSLALEGSSGLVERGESYAELLDAGGGVVSATRSLDSTPLLSPAEVRDALRGRITADRDRVPGLDDPSRLLATPVSRGGRRLALVVGVTSQDNVETLAAFRTELLIAGPLALLLASLAGYLLAGISLHQVESMRTRAAAISSATLRRRLPVPQTGDEIERLGETLNEMLDRLETALDRERDFVADAGHELRTPLTLLRTELELALHYDASREELLEAIRSSLQEVDRLGQLADDLLLIARTDRGKLPLDVQQLVANDVLDSVVNRFQWRAGDRAVLTDAARHIVVSGDRMRLEQALANIVDNAFRHGDGPVHLNAVDTGEAIELHVTDDGPGFAPDLAGHAFERFARGRTGGEQRGAGLGLAIVKAIGEAHGGTANAANRAEGGVDVWLELPKPEGHRFTEPALTSSRTGGDEPPDHRLPGRLDRDRDRARADRALAKAGAVDLRRGRDQLRDGAADIRQQ